ncbi:MAG: hypothetical protein V3T80_02220 [Kiloniellales bacterium]
MKPSAQPAPISQEVAFLDYVERLKKFTSGRRAVLVRLSALRPYNRRDHHLRIAVTTFEHLIKAFEGTVFRLFDDDLVVICNGATVADMDEAVLHLRYLFSDDPLLKYDEDGRKPFCEWYDLEKDYGKFLHVARETLDRCERQEAEETMPELIEDSQDSQPSHPLDPHNLAVIETAIAQADLSTMIRQQSICAMTSDRKPEAVYSEIYTSIESLRRTLMPTINLYANPWLFQDLTQHLDRRVLNYLSHVDRNVLAKPFSLNLNISTLISPHFLDFDDVLNKQARRGIVIELQLIDIYADLANFLFARDFLRERGYRFCLDGMSHFSLPLIDREKLGVDLVKLFWSADLGDQLDGPRGEFLREAARKVGCERIILARCDSEHALEFGQSLGITLYQGHLLDHMLTEGVSRDESARALSDALARHRVASRS